ncbi:MAG: alpha/beta hydrolase, partial [Rhodovarius sp.]|nr:alpha/beta hydrolase [Rhodovarius sp.]
MTAPYHPPPRDPALQAQYDNMARVPEAAEIIAGWARDAAAFRAAHPPRRIAYGPGAREGIDLFGPATGPVALFLHGGYWQRLDPSFFSHLAAGLVAHGVAVAVAGYDLCPHVTLRHIVAQAEAACRALPRPPVLAIGHSAGGHLAAMLLARGLVPAALPISGLFDLSPLRRTSIGDALRLSEEEARALSPL